MKSRPMELGRFFMAGLPGITVDDSTRRLIREYRVNNFILFRRNVHDQGQLAALTAELRRICLDQGLAPPLIAIDQEGGSVTRLPPPFTQFADARELAESAYPEDCLAQYARTCARELLGVGINMNLAPVLDVSPAGQGLFMEHRSLGGDPEKVARLGALVIAGLQKEGVAACAKHFPGLGAAVLDPHRHLPVVDRSLARILTEDLIPFKGAIKAGVAAIMTSHTIYPRLDPETPATLSAKVLTELLRKVLGYQGVIVTDDLEMGAIEKHGLVEEAAGSAFAAGADLLLICHDHDKVVRSLTALAAAGAAGTVSQKRLAAGARRLRSVQERFAIRR
ncbi:MAG: beta-N-acetylhexosaminidase [Desulfobacterales bacterium]|nr:beta-N-acetylhexosaminidase [Desulfobacterales bacterium]